MQLAEYVCGWPNTGVVHIPSDRPFLTASLELDFPLVVAKQRVVFDVLRDDEGLMV